MILLHTIPPVVVNKTGTRLAKVSLSLDSAPGSNVTVTPTSINSKFTFSSALTFTTSNWHRPQAITITGVSDAVNDDCIYDTLRLTATGGLSEIKDVSVAVVDDDGLLRAFNGQRWTDEAKIQNLSDVTTKRNYLIAQMFNGNGLPTNAVPSSSTIGYSGLMHEVNTSEITGFSSVNKYTWTRNDADGYTWTYLTYLIISNTVNNKCTFVDDGHILDGTVEGNIAILINSLLALGHYVVVHAMPVAGQNTEANPNIDSSSSTITFRHDDILTKGLDRWGYNAYELFLADGFMMINFLDANYPLITEYNFVGFSGGSIKARFLPGLSTNPKIKNTFINRGIIFRALVEDSIALTSDYEGGANRTNWKKCGRRVYDMMNEVEQIDQLLLACASNRKVVVMHNTSDQALTTGDGEVNMVYRDWIATLGTRVTGTLKISVSTRAAEAVHQWWQWDIDNLLIPEL